MPGSSNTKLNILGILIPTAATPYVATITLLSMSDTSAYSDCLSATFISPLMNAQSGFLSLNISPVLILSINTSVFPELAKPLIIVVKWSIRSGSVTNHLSSCA